MTLVPHLGSAKSSAGGWCFRFTHACSLGWRWGGGFSSVQSLSPVRLFATPWTTARQASLSITNSQSPPTPMSIESVMPTHLILCRPLLPPSVFPSIRVFASESVLRIMWPKYWSFSFNISPCSIRMSENCSADYGF